MYGVSMKFQYKFTSVLSRVLFSDWLCYSLSVQTIQCFCQGTIRPIVPRHKHSTVFIAHPTIFFSAQKFKSHFKLFSFFSLQLHRAASITQLAELSLQSSFHDLVLEVWTAEECFIFFIQNIIQLSELIFPNFRPGGNHIYLVTF